MALNSDDFFHTEDNNSLDGFWTEADPVGDGSSSLNSSGFTPGSEYWVEMSIPAGTVHDPWTTDTSYQLTQDITGIGDFEIEGKWFGPFPAGKVGHGFLVKNAGGDFIRANVRTTDATGAFRLQAYTIIAGGPVEATHVSTDISSFDPCWLKLGRVGDLWTFEYSDDGTIWTEAVQFTRAITPVTASLMALNLSDAPAYIARCDYFFDTANPIDPEDVDTDPPSIDIGPDSGVYVPGLRGTGDASLANIDAGSYSITYEDLPGFITPPDDGPITVDSGNPGLFVADFVELGTVNVTVDPDNATWTLTGPSAYDSGTQSGDLSINDLEPGSYSCTFDALTGFTSPTPNPDNGTLNEGSSLDLNGTYAVQAGTINVDMTGAPTGASWSISPGGYSGTATDSFSAPADTYTITYGDTAYAYIPPGTEELVLSQGGTIDFGPPIYSARSTGTLNVDVQLDGGGEPGSFGDWSLTAVGFPSVDEAGTGDADPVASTIYVGRTYRVQFESEGGGFTLPDTVEILITATHDAVGNYETISEGANGTFDTDGWTIMAPTNPVYGSVGNESYADSMVLYVSSSKGSDSNSGTLAQPLATLLEANSRTRNGKPDHVYLLRGDTWNDPPYMKITNGRSTTECAVWDSYTDGTPGHTLLDDRPYLRFTTDTSGNGIFGCQYIGIATDGDNGNRNPLTDGYFCVMVRDMYAHAVFRDKVDPFTGGSGNEAGPYGTLPDRLMNKGGSTTTFMHGREYGFDHIIVEGCRFRAMSGSLKNGWTNRYTPTAKDIYVPGDFMYHQFYEYNRGWKVRRCMFDSNWNGHENTNIFFRWAQQTEFRENFAWHHGWCGDNPNPEVTSTSSPNKHFCYLVDNREMEIHNNLFMWIFGASGFKVSSNGWLNKGNPPNSNSDFEPKSTGGASDNLWKDNITVACTGLIFGLAGNNRGYAGARCHDNTMDGHIHLGAGLEKYTQGFNGSDFSCVSGIAHLRYTVKNCLVTWGLRDEDYQKGDCGYYDTKNNDPDYRNIDTTWTNNMHWYMPSYRRHVWLFSPNYVEFKGDFTFRDNVTVMESLGPSPFPSSYGYKGTQKLAQWGGPQTSGITGLDFGDNTWSVPNVSDQDTWMDGYTKAGWEAATGDDAGSGTVWTQTPPTIVEERTLEQYHEESLQSATSDPDYDPGFSSAGWKEFGNHCKERWQRFGPYGGWKSGSWWDPKLVHAWFKAGYTVV